MRAKSGTTAVRLHIFLTIITAVYVLVGRPANIKSVIMTLVVRLGTHCGSLTHSNQVSTKMQTFESMNINIAQIHDKL